MEQTIKINVPEGKIANYNEQTQTIEFFDKEPARSRSWEEFCENHPDKFSFANTLDCPIDLSEDILALIQLTRLRDEWVGDWQPSEYDYYGICYDIDKENVTVKILIRDTRILMFPSRKMAEDFLNCFRDLIWKAKRFI